MSVRAHGLFRPLALAFAAAAMAAPALAIDTVGPATSPAASDAASPAVVPTLPDVTDPTADLLRIGADDADRMTLPVEIGKLGPYPFLIDTGSHRSIVATELARRLMLEQLPPVEIVSMAGRETVAAVHLDEMRFGNQVVSNLPALSIAHEDLGSAGLIGLDGLQNKRVTLDFKKRQLSIGKSMPVKATIDRNVIVVQARSLLGQLILVDSRLDGKRVNVILDTGAEMSVGNMVLFNKLRQKRLLIPPQKVIIKSVTGTPIEAQFTVVRELKIDSVNLQNVPMVFLDAAPFAELGLGDKPSMLLGMAMLRMFNRVAIDFGSRHVDFEVPQSSSDKKDLERLFAAL